MKKVMLLVALMVGITSSAYALYDNNSTNQSSSNSASGTGIGYGGSGGDGGNGGVGIGGTGFGGSSSVRDSGNSDNRNTNMSMADQNQGQAQGQLQGQAQGQSANNDGNAQQTNVDASSHNKGYYSQLAAASANEGTSLAAANTPFGGVNLAGTEDYKKVLSRIIAVKELKEQGFMSQATACKEVKESYLQLRDASQPNKLFNSGAISRGQNLWNGFGLLTGNTAYTDPAKFVMGCEEEEVKK